MTTLTPSTRGTVAPGFEAVHEAFTRGQSLLGDGGAAVAAFVDGDLVVDLWAGSAGPERPWEQDTMGVLMSCTKAMAGLCIHLLVDRGVLDLHERVATYWPEFAANGKSETTVLQIMTHTSGVLGWDGAHTELRADGTGWADHDRICAALAASAPSWPTGSRHGYHALSYGWLVGELVRRVDGRSIGRFFTEEIAAPLSLDAFIGTPAAEVDRVATIRPISLDGLAPELVTLWEAQAALTRTSGTLSARAYFGGDGVSAFDHLITLANAPATLQVEAAGTMGTATARGLARMHAMLSCGGELDGVRLVSADSVRLFGERMLEETDVVSAELDIPAAAAVVQHPVARTAAYQSNNVNAGGTPRFGPNPGAFGAEGFGGQLSFADPSRRVSFVFLRSQLVIADVLAPTLVDALYSALEVR